MLRQIILLFTLLIVSSIEAQKLQTVWESDTIFDVPESVLFSEKHNCLFVSNIVGSPWEKDGIGYISKLDINGKVVQKKWVEGLDAPKGMTIFKDRLFVTNVHEIVEIDLKSARILNRYPFPNSKKINDVQLGPDGNIYATDSGLGQLYRLENGKLKIWYKSPNNELINGISTEGKNLIFGTYNVMGIEPSSATKEAFILAPNAELFIDGIAALGEGWYLVSTWAGEIKMMHTSGEKTTVLKYPDREINTADFGINLKEQIIYVPTFYNKRVIAFKYFLPN